MSEIETLNGIPTVIHEGEYRLYQKPDGGIHLVYKRNDKDTEDHIDLPGAMMRLLNLASSGEMSLPQFLKEAARLRRELYRNRAADS